MGAFLSKKEKEKKKAWIGDEQSGSWESKCESITEARGFDSHSESLWGSHANAVKREAESNFSEKKN